MDCLRCRPALLFSLCLMVLLLNVGNGFAQPPLYRIGDPYPPVRPSRLTTDNGIPGTGAYYYRHYPWPSLREAIQEYGLFSRRFRQRERTATVPPLPASLQR